MDGKCIDPTTFMWMCMVACAYVPTHTPFYEPHFYKLFLLLSTILISVIFEGELTLSCATLEQAAEWQSPALGGLHHNTPGTWIEQLCRNNCLFITKRRKSTGKQGENGNLVGLTGQLWSDLMHWGFVSNIS